MSATFATTVVPELLIMLSHRWVTIKSPLTTSIVAEQYASKRKFSVPFGWNSHAEIFFQSAVAQKSQCVFFFAIMTLVN